MSTRLQVGGLIAVAWVVGLAMGGAGGSRGGGIAPGIERGAIAETTTRVRDEPRPKRPAPDAVRVRLDLNGEHRVITMPVEAGAIVEEGDLILELDPSPLKDRLAAERIETERALANHANAQKDLEVAEIELQSYVEADYPTELREAEERAELASLDFELAMTRFLSRALYGLTPERTGGDRVRSRRASFSHPLLPVAAPTERGLALQEATLEVRRTGLLLQRARRDLRTLTEFTREREVFTREWEIEKKKAELFALKSTADLRREYEARYRRMIDECTVLAPASGILRLADGLEVGKTFDFDWARPVAWIEVEPKEGDTGH